MTRTALIIDCDTGVDDAIALLLAFACPESLEILAVTTVAGNVGAELTARNSRLIRQIARREEVPVYAGAITPLVREPIAASHFHGVSGLGHMQVFEPEVPIAPGHAVNAIVDLVMARPPGSVTIAVTGPMTNLALALRLEPALAQRLARVVAMGGARGEGGNVTASAEYNIFADPHAAAAVIESGVEVVMLGLDATHQVRATVERTEVIRALGTPAAVAVAELLDFYWEVQHQLDGGQPPPLHDPCTIAWLLAPQLFTDVAVNLQVEIQSPLTLGHTAVEFRLSGAFPANCRWVTRVDADGVFGLLMDRLAR